MNPTPYELATIACRLMGTGGEDSAYWLYGKTETRQKVLKDALEQAAYLLSQAEKMVEEK